MTTDPPRGWREWWPWLRPQLPALALALLLMLVQSGATLLQPWLGGQVAGRLLQAQGISFLLWALFGLFAVLGMCWIFLGSRLALLVGLGVPFALAGTFIAVGVIGTTLNLTVLLGVVIALGMLVDDAVVIVESIYYRLQRGEPAREAVVNGIGEVGLPVLASVLTTIADSPSEPLRKRNAWSRATKTVPVLADASHSSRLAIASGSR